MDNIVKGKVKENARHVKPSAHEPKTCTNRKSKEKIKRKVPPRCH